MASIYHKNSPQTGKTLPHYYCSFRLPDGRQVHRITKQRTKVEAAKAAQALEEEALREAGAGTEVSRRILGKVCEAVDPAPAPCGPYRRTQVPEVR